MAIIRAWFLSARWDFSILPVPIKSNGLLYLPNLQACSGSIRTAIRSIGTARIRFCICDLMARSGGFGPMANLADDTQDFSTRIQALSDPGAECAVAGAGGADPSR